MNDEFPELARRRDDTAERLAELSIELLQGALADAEAEDGGARARLERSVTRARRSTLKAASILKEAAGTADTFDQ